VTRFRLAVNTPTRFALNLRVPGWIGHGARVRLNGETLDIFASPGSYLTLKREWHDGDRIEMDLPMRLSTEALPGDDNLQAALYGPLVLAARLGSKGLTHDMQYCGYDAAPKPEPKPWPAPRFTADRADDPSWLSLLSAQDLRFEAQTRDGKLAVVPLNQIHGERYAVYWQSEPAAPSKG
jgi:hypothetical protein